MALEKCDAAFGGGVCSRIGAELIADKFAISSLSSRSTAVICRAVPVEVAVLDEDAGASNLGGSA